MRFDLPRPRLLPATMAVMAALLLVKSVALVRALASDSAVPASLSHASPAVPSAASPTPADNAGAVKTAAAVPAAASATPGPGTPALNPLVTLPVDPSPVSEAERALLLDLRHRREALDERSRALDRQAALMQAADAKLGARVEQLSNLQGKLVDLEAARQKRRSEQWSGLVKVYETMKPRDAATIFDALDMQVLLQVLDRMQERRAAPVLAAMQPDRARLATQLLAEMRTHADGMPPPAAPAPKG